MSYTYFVGESQVTLFNLVNGNSVVFHKDQPVYDRAVSMILAGDYAAAEMLDTKSIVTSFSANVSSKSFSITIKNGVGLVTVGGVEYPLSSVLVDRITKLNEEGFPTRPLENFIERLYSNPSKSAVEELFLFLENSGLPITEDGCFIAYKIVRNDYKDIYTGQMDNSVGKVLEMARFAVDDNRSKTCSAGLHFCSKGYLSHYSSHDRSSDRCVLVKIDPKDVVSIPNDYDNAKGRTCRYEVIGEVAGNDWRDTLSSNDYNITSVVGNDGKGVSRSETLEGYYFNTGTMRWHDAETGDMVSRATVSSQLGVTVDAVKSYEVV